MALPTIVYSHIAASSGSADVDDIGPAIHDALIAAGWSIVYADADAIGAGSSGDPAWDKVYESNGMAGTVVYQMPANGFTTQWFVKFSLGWGSSSTRVSMRNVEVGDTHDGSGGISGGGTITATSTTSNTNNSEFAVSASEDGIAAFASANNAPKLFVERLRTSDGIVTDDVVAWSGNGTGGFLHLRASVGVVTSQAPVVLAGLAVSVGVNNFGAGASLANGDGDEIPIVGPFWPGADPFYGAPRLFFFGPAGDYDLDAYYERVADGGSKTYHSLAVAASSSWANWMMATE